MQNWSTLNSFKSAGQSSALVSGLGIIELGSGERNLGCNQQCSEGEQADGIKQDYCRYFRLLCSFFILSGCLDILSAYLWML